jgi:DNA-binding response OmpR family regulator
LSQIGSARRVSGFLSENLRDHESSVLTAATGADATKLLGRSRPDPVLLDVVLPDKERGMRPSGRRRREYRQSQAPSLITCVGGSRPRLSVC